RFDVPVDPVVRGPLPDALHRTKAVVPLRSTEAALGVLQGPPDFAFTFTIHEVRVVRRQVVHRIAVSSGREDVRAVMRRYESLQERLVSIEVPSSPNRVVKAVLAHPAQPGRRRITGIDRV